MVAARPPKPKLPSIFLTLSIAVNVSFLSSWLWSTLRREYGLTWSSHEGETEPLLHQTLQPKAGWIRKASDAAEAAALFNCSGNGEVYIDTLPTVGETTLCECFACFAGPQCAEPVENCTADADSGDPMLFASFWKHNAEESALLIPGWYRIGYELVESAGDVSILPSLEQEIRTLHSLVGNAVVENKYIVLGVGSMLLLNAAVASLSPDNETASVVSAVPYYGAMQMFT